MADMEAVHVKTYRMKAGLVGRMLAFKAATGMSEAEQVRRALSAWLTEQEQFRAQLRKSLDARTKGAK